MHNAPSNITVYAYTPVTSKIRSRFKNGCASQMPTVHTGTILPQPQRRQLILALLCKHLRVRSFHHHHQQQQQQQQ
jgi:hypothetical protein